MPYSTGEKKSNGECKCHGGYHWDKNISMCTSKNSSNKGVGIGVGVGVGVGVPVLLALLALLMLKKSPAPAVVTPVMVQPAPVTTTTVTETTKVIPQPSTTTISVPPVRYGPPPVVNGGVVKTIGTSGVGVNGYGPIAGSNVGLINNPYNSAVRRI
jgi:hypothetical protein